MTRILGIIPARGGSKGIPQKNIRIVNGKPLIAWTIESALNCHNIDRVIVSTDDNKIAKITSEYGGDVPFIRPELLAQDDTPDFPVFHHALSWLATNEGYFPEVIVWLRPTAPLRSVEDISGAISLLLETKADWVRTVCAVEHHPYWMKQLNGDKLSPLIVGSDENKYSRRQLLPPVYRLNGAVDVTWRDTIMEKRIIYSGDIRGYVMPQERSIDIDSEFDLLYAELLMKTLKL